MYFYICPYCKPGPRAKLERTIAKYMRCKYEKEELCEEKHKCKEIMQCKKCKSEFKITKDFLRECKRKIKDG